MPIREVNVNRQTISIKGRIIQKSRTLQTLRNGLRFFHIDIIDKDNDVIRIKFWRQKAEEYYDLLDQGSVYIFKCTGNDVVVSNSKFNDTSNPYEINFSDRCVLKEIDDDDDSISKAPKYSFSTIQEIKNISLPSIVDLVGVIRQFTPCTKIVSRKNNDEISRRTITLVDETEYQLNITLWGELAEIEDEKLSGNPVVALKSIQIRDYQGRQGSTLSGRSLIDFFPDNEKSEKMRNWYRENESSVKFRSISVLNPNESSFYLGSNERMSLGKSLKEIRQLIDESSFPSNQSFQVIARVSRIGFNMSQSTSNEKYSSLTYDACPKCKKKVLSTNSYCEKCDETVISDTKYLFPVTVEDYTCSLTVRCFHEMGCTILNGLDASICKKMDQNNDKKLNYILNCQCLWKCYNLRINLRTEEYNNQKKTQAIIQSAEPIDFELIATKMIQTIRENFSCSLNKRILRDETVDISSFKKVC